MSSVQIEEQQDDSSSFMVTLNGSYGIKTIVTSSAADVDRWIQSTYAIHACSRLDHLLVGLDVEWRPAFGRYSNPAAVLQLCSGSRCLVYQLLYAGSVPDSLRRFLADTRIFFLGVAVADDAEKLLEDHNLSVRGSLVDLRKWAADASGQEELRQTGLAGLARAVMGIEVAKPTRVRLGRWDAEDLNLDQIKYACIDAFLSFEIGRMIHRKEFPF